MVATTHTSAGAGELLERSEQLTKLRDLFAGSTAHGRGQLVLGNWSNAAYDNGQTARRAAAASTATS